MQHVGATAQLETADPVYLDCNATAPIEPAVLGEIRRLWSEGPGNAGSRIHEYGTRAKKP